MTGFNDVLESEEFGKMVQRVMIAKTVEMKHVFQWCAFVSLEDVAQKMVESFADEYGTYADMEERLAKEDDINAVHDRGTGGYVGGC